MEKTFVSNNHLATFSGSWGLCGAMVCSWLSKVKTNATVESQSDIGTTGSLILQQNKYKKQGEEHLFRNFDLKVVEQVEIEAKNWRHIVSGVAEPGNYYLSLRFENGDGHAIGTSAKAGKWQLFDPNKWLKQTEVESDFVDTLFSLAGDYYQIGFELKTVGLFQFQT